MNPRRLTPSMSLLLAFEASARHLSFTRAAAELSLTQSAVSRHVQALEALLDVRLFRRNGRKIVLTEVGAMYLRELTTALQKIRNASLQAMAYRVGGGAIHVAALPTFAAKWLMPRLSGFYARHPDVLIHVHSRIGEFDLELAGMDAAIGMGDSPESTWPGLEAHHLVDEHLLPVISPELACSRPISHARDLSGHLLLETDSWPNHWREWFRSQGIPESRMRLGPRFDLMTHLIQAVATGIGVGMVPRFLIEDELRANLLQTAIEAPLVTGSAYYLYISPPRAALPKVAAFREWLLGIPIQP
jgi:DNA-binding transcriptional LysR family regulator